MRENKNQASKNNLSPRIKFGTFGGVFTPCTLTILGVIMFLRFGQVVGQAGILQVILILLCAKGITTLTAFSLSAIATNTRVKGGGAYYLISRSLGVEFGGAIGVFFFLAQAISVSMYVIGFTEAFFILGDLNAIAPVITMFFMITYGTLNLACFYESITRNPSYRPKFRFSHWSTALLGAIGCLLVMFLMNPLWAFVAVMAMSALYAFISRSEIISRWGDVTSGVAFERARKALLKLEDEKYHPKNWRPSILALSGGAWKRYHIAEYAYWLAAGRGVLTLGHILTGDVEDRFARREQAEKLLRKFIRDETLAAFPVVVVESDLSEAIKALLQCHGIGGVRPNTVLLGWSQDPDRQDTFCETLRLSQSFQRSVLIVKCDEEKERWVAPAGSVDIWWRGPKHGALALLLAHLLVQSHEWRRRPMRILCTVPPKADSENMALELRELLDTARIKASVHVYITNDPVWEIAKQTGQSAVLFAEFTPPEVGQEPEFIASTANLMQNPIDVILFYNSGGVSLEA